MSLQARSAVLRSVAWATLASLTLAGFAQAQNIPNPLVRPQRGAETVQTQQAPAAGSAQRGATAAPAATARGAPGDRAGGAGLPAEERGGDKTVAEVLAGLYVTTVIGDRAVLRSLDVRTVPILAGPTLPTTAGTTGGAIGGAGTGANVAGLRSQVFMVRNGEVMSLFDKLRVLVRVRDTTVTLFDVTDIPAGQYDPLDLMDRGFPVAFRGSVDSVQALPPVPPVLIAPGEGVDGDAFERARSTTRGQRSGGSGDNRASGGSGGLSGNL